jgi:hypothetical protein
MPASADGGPGEAAAGGCALQCIEKALVTSTTSSAKIEIVTSVSTKVTVTVRKLPGAFSGPVDASAQGPLFNTKRTLYLYGLQPGSAYRIVVSATDASGRTASRSGRFDTREVEPAVDPGVGGLAAGLGCSAKCITKAAPVQIGPTAALFEVKTNTSARITVIVTLQGTGSIVGITTSPLTTSYTYAASPLNPGMRYDVVFRATDADGRTEQHQFTFKTVERKARVTFWKIKIIDDGDKGRSQGELAFGYWLGGGAVVDGEGFQRHGSGDVIQVHAPGSSRAGLTGVLPANGANPKLDVRVQAMECDGHSIIRYCVSEVTDPNTFPSGGGKDGEYEYATAGGPFGLNALLSQGALPAGYGSMLPSGHNAYLVFETTQWHVKFRVYAYLDYFYAW